MDDEISSLHTNHSEVVVPLSVSHAQHRQFSRHIHPAHTFKFFHIQTSCKILNHGRTRSNPAIHLQNRARGAAVAAADRVPPLGP